MYTTKKIIKTVKTRDYLSDYHCFYANLGRTWSVCGREQRRCQLLVISHRCTGRHVQDHPGRSIGRCDGRRTDVGRHDGCGTSWHHATHQLHISRGNDCLYGRCGYQYHCARPLQRPRPAHIVNGYAGVRSAGGHIRPFLGQDTCRLIAVAVDTDEHRQGVVAHHCHLCQCGHRLCMRTDRAMVVATGVHLQPARQQLLDSWRLRRSFVHRPSLLHLHRDPVRVAIN